jgi:hypothetical protein
LTAIHKNFNKISPRINDLVELRKKAVKILSSMEDADKKGSWKSRVETSTLGKYLKMFFTVKTHKNEPFPFRAIVDSGGTWQYQVESFLLKGLNLLVPDDPFRVKNTEEAVLRLGELHEVGDLKAVSFDAVDMYFNMEHDIILEIIEEEISKFGVIEFQNSVGLDVFQFKELVGICMKSSVVEDDVSGELFLQKKGICIGSRIAPRIADLYTARINRKIWQELLTEGVLERVWIMKFVDDYLVLFKKAISLDLIKSIFMMHKGGLDFTVEESNGKGEIQFLDLLVITKVTGVCWRNQQRKMKGILPFHSNHSKSIKVGVTKGVLRSAVLKSCCHQGQLSLNTQIKRLCLAGYPKAFISQQIVGLAVSLKSEESNNKPKWEDKRKSVIVQFSHSFGHRLRKLCKMFDIRIIFKYANKIKNLVTKTGRKQKKCGKSGHGDFVECVDNVVYNIQLQCGKCYVGQTCRCLNTRLYEHRKNFKEKKKESTLVRHLLACRDCNGELSNTSVIHRSGSTINREIVEAYHIEKGGENVISKPSTVLLKCERKLLASYHE